MRRPTRAAGPGVRAEDAAATFDTVGPVTVESIEELDLALDSYADHVPRREHVPSLREVDAGIVDYSFRPAPPPPQLAKTSRVRRFIEDVKLLNPRGIVDRETLYPLLVLSGLNTAAPFGDAIFYSVLFYVQADLGQSLGFIFALISLMELATTIGAPLVGWIADRVNRVVMLRVGTLVDSVCVILTGLAPGAGAVVASRVVGSLAMGLYQPTVGPLLADYVPVEKRARVFGFQSMTTAVWNSVSIGVIVYGLFIHSIFSWRQVMVGAGVIGLVTSLLTFRMREPVRGEVDRRSMGVSEEFVKKQQSPVSWGEAWRVLSGVATLRKLWLATPFLYVGQRGIGYLLYFAVQARLANATAGGGGGGLAGSIFSNTSVARLLPLLFLVVPNLMQIFMTPVAFAVADRLLKDRPGRIMYYYALIMAALGLVAVSALLAPDPLLMLPISMVVGALAGLIGPAQGMLLSMVIPARVRGQGFQTVAPFKIVGIFLFMSLGSLIAAVGETVAVLSLLPVLFLGAGILAQSGTDVARDIRNALASSLAEEESQAAKAQGRSKMIVMRGVGVAYEGAQVLFDVDFDVDDGELVAVLGTNGAGKSTLLKAIAGLHEPVEGAIFRDGEDITHKPAHMNARDGIVFLPGGRAVFPTLTVEENLRAAAWLYKEDDDYVRTRSAEILDFFPILKERLKQQAGDLSGGEQQMLALGQAFLMKPRLLMIDELSLGLAPKIVERLLEIVRAIHAQGTTVLLVEQSVNVALTIAERAVFLDKGEIRFDGPAEELVSRTDLVRAVFLGHTGGTGLLGAGRMRKKTGEVPERVLGVEGVEVSYGGVRALDGVSLEVFAGEVVGIIGPNGAGKTTLFDVVSGFLAPDTGRVYIGPEEVSGLAPDARALLGLSRSFQDTRLFQSLTVRETIAVALQRKVQARNPMLAALWAPAIRRAERRVERRVEYLVEVMNLGVHAEKFLSELSTGTRRMVDIACVMAAEPKILLLDEPSSGLAQAEIEVFGPVVQQLSRETGCGVLVIEHDIPLVTGMSDRLIAMELGRVIADGPPEQVASDEKVMAAYLSASDTVIRRSGAFQQAVAALGMPVPSERDEPPAPETRPRRRSSRAKP